MSKHLHVAKPHVEHAAKLPPPKKIEPPAITPAITDEDAEDEMFERELLGQHAAFVAGTPFVRVPDGN